MYVYKNSQIILFKYFHIKYNIQKFKNQFMQEITCKHEGK
jgi:hypothetical protein